MVARQILDLNRIEVFSEGENVHLLCCDYNGTLATYHLREVDGDIVNVLDVVVDKEPLSLYEIL